MLKPVVQHEPAPQHIRIVTTLIVSLLTLVVLAACSSTNTVEQVDEDFPTVQPTAAEQAAEGEPAEAPASESGEAADETESGSEPGSETDTEVANEPDTETEPLTDTAAITGTDATTDTAANEPAASEPTAAEPPPTAEPTAAPAEPVALKTGEFTFIDNAHNADGTATVYQLPDGSRILRLENFQVAEGPGIYVMLAVNPQPRSDGELFDQGQVELGELKALSGNQNYEIPADLDLDEYNSVVLYCRPYTTIMSTAGLNVAGP